MDTTPKAPEQKEKSKMEQAVESVARELEERVSREEQMKMFLVEGKERPVVTAMERTMADIQAATRIATEVLHEKREQNDYFGEKAAAKQEDLLNVVDNLALRVAELRSNNPEATKLVDAFLLQLQNNDSLIVKAEVGGNDDKFLLKA